MPGNYLIGTGGFAKIEDLQGDLQEWFQINIKNKNLSTARFIYWKQVLALIFSYAIRKRKKESIHSSFSTSALSLSMIKNYFKVAFRNIARHKYFSIVNIVGLSIGMSIGLLLIAMYSNVCSYDDFQINRENVYRIISERTDGIETNIYASAPAVLGEKIQTEFAGVKSIVRINSSFSGEVMLEKDNIPLSGYYVDDNFFSVFTYEMVEGYALTALTKPNTIVLTETAVEKLFGKRSPLGKVLEIRALGSFEVTGVMKDHPRNSHLEFEALVSYALPASIRENGGNPEQWTDYSNQYVYVLLPDKSETTSLEVFLNHTAEKMYSESADVKATFEVERLSEITPGPDLRNSIGPTWEYSGFMIFGGISLLILLPACFNYTNISIARALKRSKEIGLRKTMGGQKNQIFFQFITETVVITLISLVGGLLMFMVLRDGFHAMLAEASSLDMTLTGEMILLFIFFAFFTGLMAGAIPALYFSGLNPIQALKGQSGSRNFSGMRARKSLTVFQFCLSFCFIISLVGFTRQYRYSLNYDFGFQKENILDVELQGVNTETFKSEFSRLASVQSISMSSGVLGISPSSTWIQATDKKDSTETFQLFVDDQFIQNFKLKLIAGKNFPSSPWQQEQFIIVNQEFLAQRKIANPVDAIGLTFNAEGKDLQVIGVVKNFHFASLQVPIESFFFRMDPSQFRHANLKVSFTDTHASITAMETIWQKLSADRKFSAQFFDDEIRDAYDFYHSLLKIFGILGLLAISISLLGLLGMVVYTSENKTKEVGIRKVLGASTFGITVLLSKDYMKLMLWAAVIAIPTTIFLFDFFVSHMQHYHISLSVWDILLSFLILMILGLATITSQTIKTASTNPTETLKCE